MSLKAASTSSFAASPEIGIPLPIGLPIGDFTSTVLTNKQCVFRRSTGDETVYVAINADDQEYTAYFGAEKNQVTDLLSGAIMNLDGGLKMAPYSAYFLA